MYNITENKNNFGYRVESESIFFNVDSIGENTIDDGAVLGITSGSYELYEIIEVGSNNTIHQWTLWSRTSVSIGRREVVGKPLLGYGTAKITAKTLSRVAEFCSGEQYVKILNHRTPMIQFSQQIKVVWRRFSRSHYLFSWTNCRDNLFATDQTVVGKNFRLEVHILNEERRTIQMCFKNLNIKKNNSVKRA